MFRSNYLSPSIENILFSAKYRFSFIEFFPFMDIEPHCLRKTSRIVPKILGSRR